MRGSSSDGSSMHVQENSQHQCRLHCAMHCCGHAKRPHRLVPRAGPGQNKGALRCNLGARSPENNVFAVRAPLIFCPLSVPSLPARRAHAGRWGPKRPKRNARGGGTPTRRKEIVRHRNSTPHGQGGGLGTFLPGGAASRRASTMTATRLCAEKTRPVAQPRRKGAQKVQCGCCVVGFVDHGFTNRTVHTSLLSFLTISVPQRARNSVCMPNLMFGWKFSISLRFL